jgi:hypothetical protein
MLIRGCTVRGGLLWLENWTSTEISDLGPIGIRMQGRSARSLVTRIKLYRPARKGKGVCLPGTLLQLQAMILKRICFSGRSLMGRGRLGSTRALMGCGITRACSMLIQP